MTYNLKPVLFTLLLGLPLLGLAQSRSGLRVSVGAVYSNPQLVFEGNVSNLMSTEGLAPTVQASLSYQHQINSSAWLWEAGIANVPIRQHLRIGPLPSPGGFRKPSVTVGYDVFQIHGYGGKVLFGSRKVHLLAKIGGALLIQSPKNGRSFPYLGYDSTASSFEDFALVINNTTTVKVSPQVLGELDLDYSFSQRGTVYLAFNAGLGILPLEKSDTGLVIKFEGDPTLYQYTAQMINRGTYYGARLGFQWALYR